MSSTNVPSGHLCVSTHVVVVQNDAYLRSNAGAGGEDVAVDGHFPCGRVQDVVWHQIAQALGFLEVC